MFQLDTNSPVQTVMLCTGLLWHCKKKRVVLSRLWSLQLYLSASSTVVSKECAHKYSLLWSYYISVVSQISWRNTH